MKDKLNTDVLLKEFWRNNERFADLFNTFLFNSEMILQPDCLQELDTDVSSVIELKGHTQTISRMRDLVKKTCNGMDFVICGIENQNKVDYSMPLRNMVYDALGYLKEYHEINKRFKRKDRKKTSEEFLSGMGKDDRFHPIITIVIYYGDREWDGPYSLSDMMIEVPAGIKEIFSNYEMNLLQVKNSEEYRFANDDVETVFQISRKIYEKDFDWIFNNYKNKDIKAELGIIIGKITDSSFIISQSKSFSYIFLEM